MSSPESADFGAMLRTARERRGLTLRQLSDATKISPSVLTALESNDIGQLPGGLFVRSFVRSYAAEVGLDPGRAVDALLEAHPDQRHDTFARPRDEPTRSTSYHPQRPRTFGTGIIVLIISVLVVGLLLFFGLRGSSSSDGEVEVAAVDDVVAGGAGTSVDVAPESVLPRPSTPISPILDPPTSVTESTAGGPFSIAVHPTASCWVSVTIDGERVFAGVVGAGEREVYEVDSQMVLNVGDAGVFDFSINEQPGRPLGDAGQVITVEINRNNYLSFVRP